MAPVLGSYVLFTFSDDEALANVQRIYLSIAGFTFVLAIVFWLSIIPEITDADMAQSQEEAIPPQYDSSHLPFIKQNRLFHAAIAQVAYTGAQVAIATYFINYITEVRANTDSSLGAKFLAGAQGSFAAGRFIGSFLMKYIRPRLVFFAFISLCIVFSIPTILVRDNAALGVSYSILFFESICFPTIMALGLRGLGRHTKRGSGFIVGGVVGGAFVPAIMGAVADIHGTPISFVVPLAFFVVAWTYAYCVNCVDWYRGLADYVVMDDAGDHLDHEKFEKVTEAGSEDRKD